MRKCWLLLVKVFWVLIVCLQAKIAIASDETTIYEKKWKALNLLSRFVKKGAKEYAVQQHGAPWDFNRNGDMCGIIASDGLKNIKVENGVLSFELAKGKGSLYWGDWKKKGAPENFSCKYRVLRIMAKQSNPGPVILRSFQDGKLREEKNVWGKGLNLSKLAGKWTEIVLPKAFIAKRKHMMNASAMELEFKGKGNKIEIDWITLSNDRQIGYYRKSIILKNPPLSAVANLSPAVRLTVNGKLIHKAVLTPVYYGGLTRRNMATVDFTDALTEGENVLALELDTMLLGNYKYPYVYLQGEIVEKDGNCIEIFTNETWKVSKNPPDGWNMPGFDASAWETSKTSKLPIKLKGELTPSANAYIRVKNPHDSIPAFDEDKGLDIIVKAPSALKDKKLNWEILNTLNGNTEKKGTLAKSSSENNWNIYKMNCSGLSPGPYRLLLKLGEKDYQRRDYDFVVVGKIDQPISENCDYEADMKLKTVDVINCGDPEDKHPLMTDDNPSRTRITHSPLGSYRESGTRRELCWFSYEINVPEAHRFYLITIDYPDDDQRYFCMDIIADGIGNSRSIPQVSPALFTGVQWPVTYKMKQFKFLYWAPSKRWALNFVNGHEGTRAAVAKIKVDLIEELPALKTTKDAARIIGPITERTNIIWNTFGASPEIPLHVFSDSSAWGSWRFTFHYVGIANLIKYLKFCGANAYFAGMYMYISPHFEYPSEFTDDIHGAPSDYFALMARMFDKNGLKLYAYLKPRTNAAKQYEIAPNTDYEIRRGATTNALVDRTGSQFACSRGLLPAPNPLTKKGKEIYLGVINEFLDRYAKYPAFKGIMMANSKQYGVNFRELGYSDSTIALFEKETGIKIPTASKKTERFAKRAEWLEKNAKDKWDEWRLEKTREINLEIYKTIRKRRKDLDYIVYNINRNFENLGKKPIDEIIRSYAGSFLKMPEKEGLYSGITYNHALSNRGKHGGHTGDYAKGLKMTEEAWNSKDLVSYFKKKTGGAVFLRGGFDELSWRVVVPKGKKWIWKKKQFACNYDCPAGDNFLDGYSRALVKFNPSLIAFGEMDVQFWSGHEGAMRKFNQAFLAIPEGHFENVPVKSGFLSLRKMLKGKESYFYLVNTHWWHSIATIKNAEKVRDLISGKEEDFSSFIMKPYEIKVFKIAGDAKLLVNSRPVPEALSILGQRITEIKKAYDILKAEGYATKEQSEFIDRIRSAFERKDYASVNSMAYSYSALVMLSLQEECRKFKKSIASGKTPDIMPLLEKPAETPEKIVIPRISSSMKIDGSLKEWNKQYPIIFNSSRQNIWRNWKGLSDCSGVVYLAWDEKALYIGAEILDDSLTPWEGKYDTHGICQSDELELFLQTNPGEKNPYNRRISPHANQVFLSLGSRNTPPMIKVCLGPGIPGGEEMFIKKYSDGKGYTMEVKLPWETVFAGYKPEVGKKVKLNLALSDTDCDSDGQKNEKRSNWMSINGAQRLHRSTDKWIDAEFAK